MPFHIWLSLLFFFIINSFLLFIHYVSFYTALSAVILPAVAFIVKVTAFQSCWHFF